MNTRDALQLAIDTMRRARDMADVEARDWRKYGQELQFNRLESRMAAAYSDGLAEGITVLERLLTETPAEVDNG